MANINSQFSCAVNARNSGAGLCPINLKNIVGAMVVAKGQKITTTTLAAFKTALLALCLNPVKASRGYPIFDLRPNSPSGGDVKKQTYSTGQEAIVIENNMTWPFIFVSGGIKQLQRMRYFNVSNTAYDFFFFDSNNFFIGMVPNDGSDTIQAISSNGGYFWAKPWVANDGSKVMELSLEFNFQPKYINELFNFVKLDIDGAAAAPGLLDAFLTAPSVNVTPGSFNVQILDEIGTDLVSIYGSNFSTSYATMLTIQNATSGASITPTGATVVPAVTTGGVTTPAYLIVTCATTAPPYPASGNVNIGLGIPSVLSTAGMQYYEGNTLTVPRS